jgi:hypothetical protein
MWALALVLSAFAASASAGDGRWSIELKGGRYEPDIDGYRAAYGHDDTTYFAFAASWLIRHWLEVGAEIGYLNDDGRGTLSSTNGPGAPIELTLLPVQLYVTVRGEWKADQLFVPYAGIGATAVWYEQRIEGQGTRDGTSDPGAGARVGLQLLLNRVDPVTASESSFLENSYLFIEGQWLTAEIDDIDLGGKAWLIGFKLEF